jgi:DNA-binding response OmpR family regulator
MSITSVLYIAGNEGSYTDLQEQLAKDDILVRQLTESSGLVKSLAENLPTLIVIDCQERSTYELALCQEVRNLYAGPLVMLSGQDNEQFSLLALSLGADLALPASNSMSLTSANIRSLLRRFKTERVQRVLQFGDLTVDAQMRDVFLADQQAHLSTIEFEVIWYLARKSGCVVTREEIHQELYNAAYNGYDRNIDLYVSRIRQKIGDDPVVPRYLKTVRGAGYQFVGVQNEKSFS